jgi:hypothetical protein
MAMKVYIAQLKCPDNHCVLALAGEYESLEDAKVELAVRLGATFGGLVRDKVLKRECGICHATHLHVEITATIFTSMEEALPELQAAEQAQAEFRAGLKRSRN